VPSRVHPRVGLGRITKFSVLGGSGPVSKMSEYCLKCLNEHVLITDSIDNQLKTRSRCRYKIGWVNWDFVLLKIFEMIRISLYFLRDQIF